MISDGHIVSFLYTLTDDQGRTLGGTGSDPMSYLQGAHEIVPGLERAMSGHGPGDRFEIAVAPADGYGELEPDSRVSAPRSEFPEAFPLEPGMPVMLEDDEGRPEPVWIAAVTDDEVVLDRNHPLAGLTLHFSVRVVRVRDATEREKAHGHAHGPGSLEHE
jgi:FKBP-type peptidyl-prolyl cis-trans isomerase SlyD